MSDNYPAGVNESHPHFNPPDPPECPECEEDMEMPGGAADWVCPKCGAEMDTMEAAEPDEPDWDARPGGPDFY
jgi:tRNA(Ile2) C34 agmatinyltransferase TiaS